MRHVYKFNIPKPEMERILDENVYGDEHLEILKDRILHHMTLEQIAEKHNMSSTSIKNIIYSYDDRLKEWTKK